MGTFSSDFYKSFSPMYDSSSRGPAGFLDQQENPASQLGGQDELCDKASCVEMEACEEREGQSEDDEAAHEEQSSNPASAEHQAHSDDEEAEEEEDMEVRDMEDEDHGTIRMHPDSPLSRKDAQRAKVSMGVQGRGPSPPQPPTLEKQWQQPGLSLISPANGPPGLLKPEQAHLEHQMNMLSVLRAYSSESLAAFNGGLSSSSNGGGGGSSSSMKRTDPSGK